MAQEAVANRVFQVLSRKNKCCPMILDPNEHRRLAIILEIVRQMASGEAGESFSQQQVIALDFEALFSNLSEDTPIRQQQRAQVLQRWKQRQQAFPSVWGNEGDEPSPPRLERWVDSALVFERFQSILMTMRQVEGSFILFVDHFHRLVGTEDGIDTANLLVPHLVHELLSA